MSSRRRPSPSTAKTVGKDTVAKLVLSPVNDVWIGWKPRSRDVAREKAGLLRRARRSSTRRPPASSRACITPSIRPAQGELSELIFDVPKGATITDVLDPATHRAGRRQSAAVPSSSSGASIPTPASCASISPRAQSRPFALLIRSQIATGPLPVKQSVGLISVENAAGQIGVLGVATGNEVQLDTVTAETLSPINLEDFPGNVAPTLAAQIPGLTVRRAFRYADVKATASIKASAVEPDVRVESQDTLSLGEDRALLAVNATVDDHPRRHFPAELCAARGHGCRIDRAARR